MIAPPALRTGDVIGLVAPAGVVNHEQLERARQRMTTLGFHLRTYGDLGRKRGYLAGDDATRAAELMGAFRDPQTRAVFAVRGGYGCIRIVDRLDYAALAHTPKIFAGFSDNTVLHAALQKKCGWITFHSPNLCDGVGAEQGMSQLTEQTYWQALGRDVIGSEERDLAGEGYAIRLTDAAASRVKTIVPGLGSGRLVGGNLALVCSLLGTPYEVDTTDCVLFLEDQNEPPYRVDRFLSQLRLAGQLENLAGVLLGDFANCEPDPQTPSLTIAEVIDDFFGGFAVPVLAGFPSGHDRDNVTLPLGARVALNAVECGLRVLENPVIPEEQI